MLRHFAVESRDERATHVAAARDRREFALRIGGARTLQRAAQQRNAQYLCQRRCQFQSLVVTARTQTRAVQGYRHDCLRQFIRRLRCGP